MGYADAPSSLRVHGALILAQSIFGGGSVVGKLGLPTVNPILFALVRECTAGPILWAAAHVWHRGVRPGRADAGRLLALAFCIASNQLAGIIGIKLSNPIVYSAWQPTQPVFTCLICLMLRTERCSWLKAAGILLSTGGAMLVRCGVYGRRIARGGPGAILSARQLPGEQASSCANRSGRSTPASASPHGRTWAPRAWSPSVPRPSPSHPLSWVLQVHHGKRLQPVARAGGDDRASGLLGLRKLHPVLLAHHVGQRLRSRQRRLVLRSTAGRLCHPLLDPDRSRPQTAEPPPPDGQGYGLNRPAPKDGFVLLIALGLVLVVWDASAPAHSRAGRRPTARTLARRRAPM